MGYYADFMLDITPWSSRNPIQCDYTGWTAQEFSDRYYDRYGIDPTYNAAAYFAAGLVLYDVIHSTQSLDAHVLAQEIRARSSFKTMYADMSFLDSQQASFDSLVEQVS